jgi:glutaminase
MGRIEQFKDTDWQSIIDEITTEIRPHLHHGKVADYIPALATVDPQQFGFALTTVHGRTYAAGATDTPFSIQSISKVFALILALEKEGSALWKRVGREPSGTAFNSIVQLEREKGRPRNPFINAGALVVTDAIVGHCGQGEAIDLVLDFIRARSGNDGIAVDREVAESEAAYGDRNRALAYFMKSFGILREDVPTVTETYFNQCAIRMTVADLSRAGLFLATDGQDPISGRRAARHDHVDRVNAIMMLCGHYDRSGDFAFRVGLTGKSGVGGGILAVIPGVGTAAVWSPALNDSGNSYAGTLALEWFSDRTGVNLF